jgi:hypothetical protein
MVEIAKINGIEYEWECELSNSDDQRVSFTKAAVKGMTLIDNIFDPFESGTISIANPYDFIENEYLIRGDGRDKMKIMFKPKGGDDKSKYEIKFTIINDTNNVNPNVRSENIKTFSLIAEDAIPFSDKIPYDRSYSGKIGAILKDIFIELLGEDKIDKENWEDGDFEITYAPPLTFRYIDLIHYLMRLYYAKDGDLYVKGFISHDHIKDKYSLTLLSKTFSDNKKYLSEAFAMGDLTSNFQTHNPNNPPPEAETGEYIGQMRNFGYSTPTYGWNNDFFVNSLVFGYDPIMGEYKIKKLKIEDIKKRWSSKFVDSFKSVGGKPKPYIVSNETTKQKFKQYKFPYPIEDSVKMVEAEIHNALTFYNLQCSFSNIGDSRRNGGTFLDIYKTNDTLLKSDEKILGRWYLTELRHNFFGDSYTNEFLCTKTYVGPQNKTKEDTP